jgi:hypothetical protein
MIESITRKDLLIIACVLFLLSTYTPVNAAPLKAHGNACYVAVRQRGQYVVQTAGETGTIDVYVDGSYATTISRKNQLWYATSDTKSVVRGYDNGGLVC